MVVLQFFRPTLLNKYQLFILSYFPFQFSIIKIITENNNSRQKLIRSSKDGFKNNWENQPFAIVCSEAFDLETL